MVSSIIASEVVFMGTTRRNLLTSLFAAVLGGYVMGPTSVVAAPVADVVGTGPAQEETTSDVELSTGSHVMDVIFFDAVSVTEDSAAFLVGGLKTLTIEIYGTSSSRTVEFYGVGPSGTKRPIKGVNLRTLSLAERTDGTGELWQFDITGLVSVILTLAAVTGGNVSAKGKAVA